MKKPFSMTMAELLALPVVDASGALDRAASLGGCFRDDGGELWGTGLIEDPWKRYSSQWVRFPSVCLVERTGLSRKALARPSMVHGFIDHFDATRAFGWAMDGRQPDAPVPIDLSVNGRTVARVQADEIRSDLVHYRIGDGRHAFTTALALPPPSGGQTNVVLARRSFTGEVVDIRFWQ